MKGKLGILVILSFWMGSTGCETYNEAVPVKDVKETTQKTETTEKTLSDTEIQGSETYKALESKISELQNQMDGQSAAQTQAFQEEIDRLRNELAASKDRATPEEKIEEPPTAKTETTPDKDLSDKKKKDPSNKKAPRNDAKEGATFTVATVHTPTVTATAATAKKVEGIKVNLQTCSGSHVQDGSTDTNGKIMFDLCPTSNFNDRGCFRARFNDQNPEQISLNAGEYAALNFVQDPQLIDSSRKKLKNLKYPDDFKYFRFASDPENEVHDGWCLQGVELKVKLEGEDYKPIYRNPCLMRWIEAGDNKNLYSPHSIENDDAFCLYIENDDGDNAGTNDSIFARVPMNQEPPGSGNYLSFDDTTRDWIAAYHNGVGESPEILYESRGAHKFEVPLHYNGWDDFGDDDDDERCASYTWTVYDGGHRMAESLMRIRGSGGDAMKIRRVRAYSFRPGDPGFLSNNECRFAEQVNANFWLGGESDDDGEFWPRGEWLHLEKKNCSQLSDIHLNGQWAFDKFGEDCHPPSAFGSS